MPSAEFQQHITNLTRLEERLNQKADALATSTDQQGTRAEIKDLTHSIQVLLQKVKLVAEEQESEGEKSSMLDKLSRHEKEFERLKGGIRKATLQARESAEKRERSDLLGDATGQAIRKRNAGDGTAKALATSAAVTSSLQRMQQTMAAELQRSANTAQTLEASSNTLQSTAQETSSIDTRLGRAKTLLQRIGRNNCSDMALMVFGILVFVAVVLYILKRRVYDKVF